MLYFLHDAVTNYLISANSDQELAEKLQNIFESVVEVYKNHITIKYFTEEEEDSCEFDLIKEEINSLERIIELASKGIYFETC